ncbi:PLP-dependent aminotransferase family protein [Chromobacterium subtsugae]|uniref:aminotransferase-like domain-containing protein n=1 Tax=Chromobacterium subtsugae TaxID=251747 RepID=UPI0007F8C090|nr:PLP-dependent aminotransferase family protein [Chromobacterium subtsugae]OBU85385.1 GntR family transcriptional regulator [Chromobacterium subtsugae]
MPISPIAFHPGSPKVQQIVESLSEAILQGTIPAGSKLPSIRELTRLFGVGKFTVIDALDRLRGCHLVSSRQGRGFFVSPLNAAPTAAPLADLMPQDLISILRRSLIADNGAMRPGSGHLPESWLDTDAYRQAMRATVRSPLLRISGYGSPAGYLPLRQALQQRLSLQGMTVQLEQIVTTANTVQAIDMLLRLLLRPGDTVLLDDPCYFNFHANLALHGASVVTIARNTGGIDFDQLETLLAARKPRIYLTTSLLHNPTGHSFTPAQSYRLLQLTKQYGCHIVEDDLYGDLHSSPPPRLAALAGFDHVSYLSGFSKVLSANTRASYVVTTPDLSAKLCHLKLMSGGITSELLEQLLCRMLTEGSYGKHRNRLVVRLLESGSRVAEWLRQSGCEPAHSFDGGMFIWARLPAGIDAEELAQRGLEQDLVLAPGTLFSRNPDARRFMRFNVASSDDAGVAHRFAMLLSQARAASRV